MDQSPGTTPVQAPSPAPKPLRVPGENRPASFHQRFRNRLIGGLIFALPIAITFSIVYWLLITLQRFVLDPLARLTASIQASVSHYPALENLPGWWYEVASPLLAIFLGIATLYFLGLALRSWVYRTVEWFLMRVPVVNTIYRAVRNVVESLGSQLQSGAAFKRVVLVEFPHPGMRSLGLVTNSLRDVTTGRTILTVYITTGFMPPAGFTLFVPEESVTNIAWNVNETLQAIISAGLTTPPTIHYDEGLRTPLPAGGGPIVDAHGNVLAAARDNQESEA
jgi:uncharacterized membrane protein